jgi:hypothetical protein
MTLAFAVCFDLALIGIKLRNYRFETPKIVVRDGQYRGILRVLDRTTGCGELIESRALQQHTLVGRSVSRSIPRGHLFGARRSIARRNRGTRSAKRPRSVLREKKRGEAKACPGRFERVGRHERIRPPIGRPYRSTLLLLLTRDDAAVPTIGRDPCPATGRLLPGKSSVGCGQGRKGMIAAESAIRFTLDIVLSPSFVASVRIFCALEIGRVTSLRH